MFRGRRLSTMGKEDHDKKSRGKGPPGPMTRKNTTSERRKRTKFHPGEKVAINKDLIENSEKGETPG